jgi:hypothetical protein
MDKKSGSGSGMINPDHISESLETIFWIKNLNSSMRIRDSGWKKIGFAIRNGKVLIRAPGWKMFGSGIPATLYLQH